MLILLLLSGSAARAEEAADVPVRDYIRLHVIANDDGEAAQALKLEVRDAVLAAARALLADCGGSDEAWRRVGENLEEAYSRCLRAEKTAGEWLNGNV